MSDDEMKISIKIENNDGKYMSDRQLKRFILSMQDEVIRCTKIIEENVQYFDSFKVGFYTEHKHADLEVSLWKDRNGFYCTIDNISRKGIASVYLEIEEKTKNV